MSINYPAQHYICTPTLWCLLEDTLSSIYTTQHSISVTTRSEFLNESESGGSGGSSDPETRYDCNESESGGSGGSWRVLKHPGVYASIM